MWLNRPLNSAGRQLAPASPGNWASRLWRSFQREPFPVGVGSGGAAETINTLQARRRTDERIILD